MSVFKYNKHGHTDGSKIGNIIYEETERQFFKRVSQHSHGPPPVSKHMRASKSSMQLHHPKALLGAPRANPKMDPLKNAKLRDILKKFDNHVFSCTKPMLQVFKRFDVDGDGFVSHTDLKKRVKIMNILTSKETDILLQYADDKDLGYLDFKQFS